VPVFQGERKDTHHFRGSRPVDPAFEIIITGRNTGEKAQDEIILGDHPFSPLLEG
jgi:hypothetical protein